MRIYHKQWSTMSQTSTLQVSLSLFLHSRKSCPKVTYCTCNKIPSGHQLPCWQLNPWLYRAIDCCSNITYNICYIKQIYVIFNMWRLHFLSINTTYNAGSDICSCVHPTYLWPAVILYTDAGRYVLVWIIHDTIATTSVETEWMTRIPLDFLVAVRNWQFGRIDGTWKLVCDQLHSQTDKSNLAPVLEIS